MTTIAHNRFIDPEEQNQGPRSVLENTPEFFVDVVGEIQWRPGDGMLQAIPKVRAGVNEAIGSWILSWTEDGEPVNAALAKEEFELYLERGDIQRA